MTIKVQNEAQIRWPNENPYKEILDALFKQNSLLIELEVSNEKIIKIAESYKARLAIAVEAIDRALKNISFDRRELVTAILVDAQDQIKKLESE